MGEPHAALVEHVEDRVPAVREVPVAGGHHLLGGRREHRDVLPDGGAGEAHDGLDAEPLRRPRGQLHLLGRPLTHALRVAVAPDVRGQDRLVPRVDRVVADGLALEVVGDRVDLEAVLLEQVQLALDVGVVLGRLPRVEVVAPAGDLQAVVAPLGRQAGDLLEGQVGPLAGEQRDRSCHRFPLSLVGGSAMLSGRRAGAPSRAGRGLPWPRCARRSATTSYDAARRSSRDSPSPRVGSSSSPTPAASSAAATSGSARNAWTRSRRIR